MSGKPDISSAKPRAPRRKYANDVAIALAVVVALLGFWTLLARAKRLPHGLWLQSHVFGSAGVRFAQSLAGGGASNSVDDASTGLAPAAGTVASGGTNPASTTVGGFVMASTFNSREANPETNQLPALAQTDTNPVTLIASLPDDVPVNTNSAAAIASRLAAAGAKTGDIQLSLYWNNFNDLDLHCIDPKNEEIFFSHKISEQTKGELDVDRNASTPYTSSPVENIFWPPGSAPAGSYQVFVVNYALHNDDRDPTRFSVRTVIQGKTNLFSYLIYYRANRDRQWVCSFQYDPGNPDADKRCRLWWQR